MKKTERRNYKKAYNILMDYWDSLPDEDKEQIDKDLNEFKQKNLKNIV